MIVISIFIAFCILIFWLRDEKRNYI